MGLPRGAVKIYELIEKIVFDDGDSFVPVGKISLYGLPNGNLVLVRKDRFKTLGQYEGKFVKDIYAIKSDGSLWPNQRFKHDFKKSSKAVITSKGRLIYIKSMAGRKLWKYFNYPEKTRTRTNPPSGKITNELLVYLKELINAKQVGINKAKTHIILVPKTSDWTSLRRKEAVLKAKGFDAEIVGFSHRIAVSIKSIR